MAGSDLIPRAAVLLWLAVGVAGVAMGAGDAPPTGLTDARILDDTRVIDVAVELDPTDWEALRNQSRDMGRALRGDTESPFTWFRGAVTVDGVRLEGVGIRKKGFLGSLDSSTPSLLVDFNRFVDQDPVEGMTRLTLNNNKQDRSLVSQAMAYGVFRRAGLAAPRVGFAAVTVNGEDLGIYSNVEPVRRPFLARSFGDGQGTLWEGTICDILPESVERMEVKTKGADDDAARLAELATLVAAEGPLDLARLAGVVDLDHFLRFWSVEALLNVWDGYCANQNNYFVYASPVDGLLRFVPWGADATAGPAPGLGGPFGGRRAAPAVYAQAGLPNRLYFADGMADRYRAVLERMLEEVWREEELLAEIDRLAALLAPRLSRRQADAPQALEGVRTFVRSRRAEVERALADWPAAAPATWRRPMTSRPLGTAVGTFAATYREGAADEVPPGDVALEVEFDGARVALRDVEASVSTFVFPGFGGGRGGDPPISVVISATRADDGKPLTLNLFLDRRRVAGGDEVPVNGMVTEGTSGFGIPGFVPMRTIDGTFQPAERGLEPGNVLGGRLDLRVTQLEGGLMNRAPMQRPGADSPAAEPAPTAGPAAADGDGPG